jgi:hypothetical protein
MFDYEAVIAVAEGYACEYCKARDFASRDVKAAVWSAVRAGYIEGAHAEFERLKDENKLLKIDNANGKEAIELMRWINQKNPGIVSMAITAMKEKSQ